MAETDYISNYSGQEIDAAIEKVHNANSTPTAGSQKMVTSGGVKAALDLKANSADLAPVATGGSYNNLTDKPDLKPVATSGSYPDLTNKPDYEGLTQRVETVEGKIPSAATSSNKLADKAYVTTLVQPFITRSVSDLVNYYLKSETYTKTEVNNIIGALNQFKYEIYASLSAITNPSASVLYLIGPSGTGSDKYEEYVYANRTFTKIGDTTIDLSNYVTITMLNTALANYVTSSALASALALKASISDLNDGSVIPALAVNLESWDDESLMAEDEQSGVVFTSGGDTSIDSSVNAQFISLGAKTDFAATSLVSSGFNLLRLASNNGIATQVGTGYYFPVPALPFGQINTAEKPNGILFTNSNGDNLHPTVYFKALSAGVPTGINDGSVCAYTDATTNGKSYRFYTTEQPGYIIVSGITLSATCAHIAWSKRYDEFISPTAAGDAGAVIPLTSHIAAMHSYGLMLSVGGSSDRLVRLSATSLQWQAYCDRIQPTWTDTLQDDGTTYLHTATIANMKNGGRAEFMTADITLSIDGNVISYTDSNATANTDYVKYEKAEVTTGNRTGLNLNFKVEDWGVIALLGASGSADSTIAYAQGIPDNVRALVSAKLGSQTSVLAEAIAALWNEVKGLRGRISDYQILLQAQEVDAISYKRLGYPEVIVGDGVPAQETTPQDWAENFPGVTWRGVPIVPLMYYYDATNSHWYRAKAILTGAVTDWVAMF